jgi:hypothetical protein
MISTLRYATQHDGYTPSGPCYQQPDENSIVRAPTYLVKEDVLFEPVGLACFRAVYQRGEDFEVLLECRESIVMRYSLYVLCTMHDAGCRSCSCRRRWI